MIGFKILKISGDSMHPELRDGQMVIVRKPKQLEVNDVVVVMHHGIQIIKRIIAIEGPVLHLAGDNKHESSRISTSVFEVTHKLVRKLSYT